MPTIHFLDVTNRDGVQTARTGLSKFGKVMVNFYLGRLGVAQSEIGFPFLFHEVPYVRACLALAEAGAFGGLRLSGWCRAVPAAVRAGRVQTVGVNAEDGSRTDDGYLLEFALAAKEAGASRVRYCDTIGGDSPGRIRERFAKLPSGMRLPAGE